MYVDGADKRTWARFAKGDNYYELKDALSAFVENVKPTPFGEWDFVLQWFHERAEELGRWGVMQDYEVQEFMEWSWDLFDRCGFIEND